MPPSEIDWSQALAPAAVGRRRRGPHPSQLQRVRCEGCGRGFTVYRRNLDGSFHCGNCDPGEGGADVPETAPPRRPLPVPYNQFPPGF